MKKRTIALIVLAASAPFLLCGGCVLLLLVAPYANLGEHQMTPQERGLVITVADLQAAGIGNGGNAVGEVCKAKLNFDRSIEIEYEYDSDLDPANQWPIYVQSQVDIDRNEKDAKVGFPIVIAAFKVGFSMSGADVKLEPDNSAGIPGDDVYTASLTKDNETVGRVIICRRGKFTFTTFTGPYEVTNDAFASVLQAKYDKALTLPEK